MAKVSNDKKFAAIKARVADLRQSHGDAIKRGVFLHIASNLVLEMEWLIAEVERLQGQVVDVPEEDLATA